MINTENEIFIQETEVKPNRYAFHVMSFCLMIIVVCWLMNELGLFRVGNTEMRIGSFLSFTATLIPLVIIMSNKNLYRNKKTKYMVVIASCIFTFSVSTLLTFHTTIMLLFPMFLAMLYKSKSTGFIAAVGSLFCTVFSPIIAYILGTWDIELFKELILIGTNGTAVIEGAFDGIFALSISKILLYLVFPRLLMVGSCTLLMFYVISLGADHVNTQIKLYKISKRDALTGLYNQNYYKEIEENAEGEDKVAVVYFDVNGLKKMNDAKGHEYGDILISRCAKSILNICDDKVTFGFRVGGDEFLILIMNGDDSFVNEKIEQWSVSLEDVNKENRKDFEGIICSMAFGYSSGMFADLEKITKMSDKNMYENKVIMKANRQ